MILSIFDAKNEKESEPKDILNQTTPILNEKKTKQTEEEYLKEQSIAIGLDARDNVKRASKGFFNSKNPEKKEAYTLFEKYIETLTPQEKKKIQTLKFEQFKEKEEQIFLALKSGFAQYITKGTHLEGKFVKIVDFVFGDIKKLPSKGHRYWYYTIYIWQRD